MQWLIVLVLCAILGLHNGSRTSPTSLVDEFRARFGVDYGGVGTLIGAYTLTYAFAQLSAGFLTDRFGARRLLVIGLGMMAASSAAFALAPTYAVALGGRYLMGIAGGLLFTPSIAYCLSVFGRFNRARAMAFAQSGTGAGLVLSAAGLPLLFTAVGLTTTFLVFPLLSVALMVVVWRFLPASPAERRGATAGLSALVRTRDFWLLLVGYAFVGMFAQSSVLSWIPTYLRFEHGWTAVQAGLASGVVATGLLVFPPPFGLLADRVRSRRTVMLVGCAVGLAGWAVLLVTGNALVAVSGAVLVSASMAATIPIQSVYATERFAAVGAGTAVGLINTGAQIAQSLAGPAFGGVLDSGFGFGAIWVITLALGLVRTVAVLLLTEPSTAGVATDRSGPQALTLEERAAG